MSMQQPMLLTWRRDLLKNPKGGNSSPCPKQNFKSSGMDGLRARLQKEGISREASNVSIKSRRSTQSMNRPGVNGLAGALKGKLIHFVVI